ncbi:hypothetical protein ACMAZE_12705 [Pseudopelagicola sp. nBUS_20]|uniref:hypothetical protein n=1 Tax=Pseudopelagicola sp. nBUS_20 TaxID=3395317 RepID=UPI003EBC6E0A
MTEADRLKIKNISAQLAKSGYAVKVMNDEIVSLYQNGFLVRGGIPVDEFIAENQSRAAFS